MKYSLRNLSFITLIFGVLGALLRGWLFGAAEESGLLPFFHISQVLVLVVTAAFLLTVYLWLRRLPAAWDCRAVSAQNRTAALGAVLAAVGNTLHLASFGRLYNMAGLTGVYMLIRSLGLLVGAGASLAMLAVAADRWKGKQSKVWILELIAVYMMMQTILLCQNWRSCPQVLRYYFPLAAALCAMLSAYHQTAWIGRPEGFRSFVFTSQCTLFFSLLSLNDPGRLYFVTTALWSLSFCLSNQVPEQQKEDL